VLLGSLRTRRSDQDETAAGWHIGGSAEATTVPAMSRFMARALSSANRALARADVALVRRSTNRGGGGAPVHLSAARLDPDAPASEHDLVHEERTRRLAAMPPGAKVVLSAGCAGPWYFEWLDAAYPGIERHIGLEAYLPKPTDLPERITWLAESVRSMRSVDDDAVDLVFSGQNVEHLWAADLVGFLLESRRVLRDGGWLVIDSPNAFVSDALNYLMPEHVAELTPMEITELLGLAGFRDVTIHGIWLCFDRESQLLLPLAPNRVLGNWTPQRRRALAVDRPDDSFVWWAEARAGGEPDIDRLVERADGLVAARYRHRLRNPVSSLGRLVGRGERRWCSADEGERGALLRGPRAPLHPGSHTAHFELRRGVAAPAAEVARIAARSESGATIAERVLRSEDIAVERASVVDLPLVLGDTAFGVELIVESTGAAALTTALAVDLTLRPSVPFFAHQWAAVSAEPPR
jgi:hypothetical protein